MTTFNDLQVGDTFQMTREGVTFTVRQLHTGNNAYLGILSERDYHRAIRLNTNGSDEVYNVVRAEVTTPKIDAAAFEDFSLTGREVMKLINRMQDTARKTGNPKAITALESAKAEMIQAGSKMQQQQIWGQVE